MAGEAKHNGQSAAHSCKGRSVVLALVAVPRTNVRVRVAYLAVSGVQEGEWYFCKMVEILSFSFASRFGF
jgi:hypothetical protein